MTKRKAMMKSMRNAMTKSAQKAKSMGKVLMKLTRKAVTKLTRKVKRKVKTRRAKRLRGGDYKEHVVDTLELTPILAEDSPELSVSVPGFGTIGMKAYRQYMKDLDTRGPRQM
jgi:hypothetical protein